MGGAVSQHGSFLIKEGLSTSEKTRIATKLQFLFEELKAANKAEDEIFTAMSTAYADEQAAIVKERGARPAGGTMTANSPDSITLNTELSQRAMVANFIDQLKEADTPAASKFRARRLSSAHTYEKGGLGSQPAVQAGEGGETVLYSSTEIDGNNPLNPHFSTDILGSFSCHGIEPSDDDDGGIHQKTNQDRGCVVYPFNNSSTDTLFVVLDGHGEQGDLVSDYVMRQFVTILEKHPSLTADPVHALKDSIVKSNTSLMATSIKYMTSGCTCVAVYMQGNTFYVANVGDSRCVAGIEHGGVVVAKDFTQDHKPDDPNEMARIIEWGGFVSPAPEPGLSARVWLDARHTMIGLAMSRSIGDFAVKSVGVIPEPDVTILQCDAATKFIILASDGVWEFIDSQAAVDIVSKHIAKGANAACKALIEAATSRWREEEGDYRDDITAIVVQFPLKFQN